MVKFIDLFAGMGGIRKGFEQACRAKDIKCKCVFTSEIKDHALTILKQNNPNEIIHGDITQINATAIPNFDFLLAGFPCQAFSSAGKRLGFEDTRGTLFFEVARILKEKKPFGFILENVEGLVNHDRTDSKDSKGKTLTTILNTLKELGYSSSWKVLNAKDFGVPQDRKRVYIVGTRKENPSLDNFKCVRRPLSSILQTGLPTANSDFISLILKHYNINDLHGKAIKDKRGGNDNIHSWDLETKGPVSSEQKELLNLMLKERRKKKWAEEYGIDWMDGMPLTPQNIESFYYHKDLKEMLEDLSRKGYVKKEHPKRKVGNKRIQDENLPLGYNIVTGKMSFEVNKILDPKDVAPTLVAMDMKGLYVVDGVGIRTLSLLEGLRLFGYPDDYKFYIDQQAGFDLLGNTVVVPVIEAVAGRTLEIYQGENQ